MRTLVLFLLIMMLNVYANADICDPNWLADVNGYRVRNFININAGIDINKACDLEGNRPLHRAILRDEVDPSVIEALLDAGADAYAENIGRSTPMNYAEDRFGRAMVGFQQGSSAYQREEAIYNAMMGMSSLSDTFNAIMDADSDTFNAITDAYSKLCDFGWWRGFSSDHAVQSLLSVPGVDPNHICNSNNDRPIHLSLKVPGVRILNEVYFGIQAFIDAGADLDVRNDDGHSALDLAEIRYNEVADSIIQHQIGWCRGEVNANQFGYEVRQTEYEINVYAYIKASVTEQTFSRVQDDLLVELYRSSLEAGRLRIDKDIICPYRGIDVQ